MKVLKVIGIILVIIVFIFSGRLIMFGKKSKEMRPNLKEVSNRFLACPNKPNCVHSEASDEHKVKPIQTTLNLESIKNKVSSLKNVELVVEDENYLHFEFTSKLLGFVDDVELELRDGILRVKSNSRVGYSDLGANLKRVEMLRELLR